MFKNEEERRKWLEYLELHQASDDEWEREYQDRYFEEDEENLWRD